MKSEILPQAQLRYLDPREAESFHSKVNAQACDVERLAKCAGISAGLSCLLQPFSG